MAATPAALFRFLADGLRSGRRGVLATITALTDTGPRALGAHMAILDDGGYAGSFSGGCVEAAIVAEALDALAAGTSRTVRFGDSSPYLDIRLPCGGAMDVLFVPDPSDRAIEQGASLLAGRAPVTLTLTRSGGLTAEAIWADRAAGWTGGDFRVRHAPPLSVIAIGQGAESLHMVRLARAYGAEVALLSPDQALLAAAGKEGVGASHLASPASLVLAADAWTAIILLFHDHDWEDELLARALATPAFWIGAMGNPRTHQARLAALAARGATRDDRARVRGPIGLIPSSRDPATLALSALAEIVDEYRKRQA